MCLSGGSELEESGAGCVLVPQVHRMGDRRMIWEEVLCFGWKGPSIYRWVVDSVHTLVPICFATIFYIEQSIHYVDISIAFVQYNNSFFYKLNKVNSRTGNKKRNMNGTKKFDVELSIFFSRVTSLRVYVECR